MERMISRDVAFRWPDLATGDVLLLEAPKRSAEQSVAARKSLVKFINFDNEKLRAVERKEKR